MESTDATTEIARSFGATVLSHPNVGFADPAREFAVSHATGEWILVLDADELVPPTLGRRLTSVARANEADVVLIPRLNYLLGAPLRHTGWGPGQNRHPRFFRKGHMQFSDAIHAFMAPASGSRVLELPAEDALCIVHFNYLDAAQFIDRLNRYTAIEARQALERGKRLSRMGAVARSGWEFVRRFVVYQGFRDGWRGFYLAGLMAFYRLATAAKLAELEAGMGPDVAASLFQAEAERLLAASGDKGVIESTIVDAPSASGEGIVPDP